MFSNKAKEELGKLFINMALASFVFAILQPILQNNQTVVNFIIGITFWLIFSFIGVLFLNKADKIKEKQNGK